ncbi:MAG: hypothetical protein WC052_02860 [Patescibacteria group bacterium]
MNKKLITVALFLLLVLAVAFSLAYFFTPKTGILNKEDAINAVIRLHPELEAYKTTSLPPSSIETKEARDGWYVGFIQSGSGVPGILNAKCYKVDEKNVAPVGTYAGDSTRTTKSIVLQTCEPVFAEQPTETFLAYGDVELQLNQLATFKDIAIRPLSIEEDSRCPNDVQCIQAGTVRVKVEILSGVKSSTSILKLGERFTTEGEIITLNSVTPVTNSKVKITDKDYRFVFSVVQELVKNPDPEGKCFVGGCSSQLCTDQPDAASTCEYKSQYACFKAAKCERQSNGQCGWTETEELSACLAKEN